ncbi:DUF397 domain-containing protein [Nocardia seriolae]|uniref:DUF397 domain-containing protein n=1 Tax=Nocardia seriolae TaxID=37332 RepID=A0ABC9YPE5_9NOCA|nr:DUF397 domain-containing protein [Nocardia seriolae]APB00120.1 hypothetical protein NS506_06083 [Nocardia seriolae]OJF79505.1 hypothetical protein NS14008_10240 [Nocardia seriolae]PSK32201.1 DUF397 domain-containing protein [Nocardia seriolae]QOW36575.1 DUF397 domain-containing protein [Nocardia seriolae]QUN15909.1 DUF397 domain-containing protein [Nocardia seriolae]
MKELPETGKWYKSSRSDAARQCVEIYLGDGRVGVRDSKSAGCGPELWFSDADWRSFLASRIWDR